MTDVQLVVSISFLFLPILVLLAHVEVEEICRRLESSNSRTIQAAERCTTLLLREMREANQIRGEMERHINNLSIRSQK